MGKAIVTIGLALLLTQPARSQKKDEVVGRWALDAAKSNAAGDGNGAGVMAAVEFKPDGSFAALYGIGGTWTRKGKKLLISYSNDYRKDLEAPRDGEHLKMPAPAAQGKYCYLTRAK